MNINFGKQTPEKPWKWTESKDGVPIPIPGSKQIRPSKYRPDKGKRIKTKPHCFCPKTNKNVYAAMTGHCNSCMWRFTCNQ